MKFLKYFIGFLFFSTVLVSAHSREEQDALTLKKIRETRAVSLGVRDSAAPFSSIKNGLAQGYTVEICNNVVAELERYLKQKIEIKYVTVNANNRIDLLKNGTIDMECGSTTDTRAREKEVAFTYPIFVSGARFAVRKDSPINDYANIDGSRVVVVQGSTCSKLIQPLLVASQGRGNGIKLIEVKDNNAGVLAVSEKSADAFCTDDVLLASAISDNKLEAKLHRVSRPLSIEPYAVMMRKDDGEFLKVVDGIIANYLTSGLALKNSKKWFETENFKYKLNHMTISALSYPVKTPATPD